MEVWESRLSSLLNNQASFFVGLGKPAPKLDEKTELFVCLEAAVHVVGCYNIVRGHVIGD